jgi:tRNA G46 methylase TrmB
MLDLGTGDGAAVLKSARRDPRALAIGVDTEVSRLYEASAQARKAKLPNALFLLGDASEALHLLRANVDEVRISLPWGSLLRLVLEGEADFAHAVAGSL